MTAAAPTAGAAAAPASALHAVLDDLIEGLGAPEVTAELADARQGYDERRGRVFEDEELWESWTQAFLEWFALERASSSGAPPPAAEAMARGDDDAPALRALCTSHRSLFEILELRPGAVELRDLLGGGVFQVDEPRALHGVSVGDVAELRLIGFRGQVLFGRTFCYHPTGTRDAITDHARRLRAGGTDRRQIMDFCASLRVRCTRYRHVSAVKVYQSARGTDTP